MIAMIAVLATDSPNVGPIDSTFGVVAPAEAVVERLVDLADVLAARACRSRSGRRSCPSSGLSTVWIFASPSPCAPSASRTSSSLAERSSGAVIRVPDSKSMPKLRPLPPIASAPISRITPDIEKNHFDAPMKSNVILRFACPAPSAERLLQELRARAG